MADCSLNRSTLVDFLEYVYLSIFSSFFFIFPGRVFCLDGSQVHPSIHLCSLLGANERLAPRSVNGSLGEGASDPSSQKPILIDFLK